MTFWERLRQRFRKRPPATLVVVPYPVEAAPLRPGWRAQTKPDVKSWDRSTWPTKEDVEEMRQRKERTREWLRARGLRGDGTDGPPRGAA